MASFSRAGLNIKVKPKSYMTLSAANSAKKLQVHTFFLSPVCPIVLKRWVATTNFILYYLRSPVRHEVCFSIYTARLSHAPCKERLFLPLHFHSFTCMCPLHIQQSCQAGAIGFPTRHQTCSPGFQNKGR